MAKKKSLLNKCDEKISNIIRLRDRMCLICKKPGTYTAKGLPVKGLDCHHIIGRQRHDVRFEPLNLVSLCKSCHRFGHKGISPHASLETIERFWNWLKTDSKVKDHWEFYQGYKQEVRRKTPLTTIYEDLTKELKEAIKAV